MSGYICLSLEARPSVNPRSFASNDMENLAPPSFMSIGNNNDSSNNLYGTQMRSSAFVECTSSGPKRKRWLVVYSIRNAPKNVPLGKLVSKQSFNLLLLSKITVHISSQKGGRSRQRAVKCGIWAAVGTLEPETFASKRRDLILRWNPDDFPLIGSLTEHWPPSAAAISVWLTQTPLLRSCQSILKLLPLPTIFSSSLWNGTDVSIAVLRNQVRLTHKWSQQLGASKRKIRSTLR